MKQVKLGSLKMEKKALMVLEEWIKFKQTIKKARTWIYLEFFFMFGATG